MEYRYFVSYQAFRKDGSQIIGNLPVGFSSKIESIDHIRLIEK